MDSHLQTSDYLYSPQETIDYLKSRYGITISLASFYSMISRGQSPKVTYWRGRPNTKNSLIRTHGPNCEGRWT